MVADRSVEQSADMTVEKFAADMTAEWDMQVVAFVLDPLNSRERTWRAMGCSGGTETAPNPQPEPGLETDHNLAHSHSVGSGSSPVVPSAGQLVCSAAAAGYIPSAAEAVIGCTRADYIQTEADYIQIEAEMVAIHIRAETETD